jgi:surface polysaccharide O-acyltransferase-like enzyme
MGIEARLQGEYPANVQWFYNSYIQIGEVIYVYTFRASTKSLLAVKFLMLPRTFKIQPGGLGRKV